MPNVLPVELVHHLPLQLVPQTSCLVPGCMQPPGTTYHLLLPTPPHPPPPSLRPAMRTACEWPTIPEMLDACIKGLQLEAQYEVRTQGRLTHPAG